jgi:hypothetical protein
MHDKNQKLIQNFGKKNMKRETRLGTYKRRCDDNVTVNLKETASESMDWIHRGQDRDQQRAPVNTVMNLQVL